jgi:hypothetical protein
MAARLDNPASFNAVRRFMLVQIGRVPASAKPSLILR